MGSLIEGLSIIAQDPENSNSQDTRFVSLQYSNSENVLIAGTADETFQNESYNYRYTSLSHGKFSKLSLVEPDTGTSLKPRESIEKGEDTYTYVDDASGELRTKKLKDALPEIELEQIRLKDEEDGSQVVLSVEANALVISDSNESVSFSIGELKQLKQMIGGSGSGS